MIQLNSRVNLRSVTAVSIIILVESAYYIKAIVPTRNFLGIGGFNFSNQTFKLSPDVEKSRIAR